MYKLLWCTLVFIFSIQLSKAQYGFNFKTFNNNDRFERDDSVAGMRYSKTIPEIIFENDTNLWLMRTKINNNEDFIKSELKFDGEKMHVISFSFYGLYGYNHQRPAEFIKYQLILIDNKLLFDGLYSRFSMNNDTLETGLFSNGLQIGLWKYFNKAKNVYQTKYFFGKSFTDFFLTLYYYNGMKKLECLIVNNLYEDTFTYYYFENGNIQIKGCYKSGIRVGEWCFYHLNGKLLTKGIYSGNFITRYIPECEKLGDNYPSSAIYNYAIMRSICTKRGKWKYWDSDSKPVKIEKYDNIGNIKKIKYFNDTKIPETGIFYELNGLFIDLLNE